MTPHRTPNPPCQLRHPGGLSLPLLLTDPPLTSMRSTVCPHEEEGPSPTEAAALGPEHQGLACALDACGATTPRRARRCLHGDAQQPHRHPAPLGLSRTPLASTAPARQRQAHVEVPPQLCGGPGATGARRSPPQGLPSRLPPSALLRSLCGRSPFATACHSTVPHPPCEPGPQHPRPGARRSPALGRDSKHRAEAPRPQHARHVPRSTRGQGADEVQSAPSAGTLGQQSTAPPTTAQHLAGDLNGLLSEAAGTSVPGPCPPWTERSPPPAPAEPRGLPATWGQLAGEAATRLLRPRVLGNSGTSERAPGLTAGPWFSKTGGGGM